MLTYVWRMSSSVANALWQRLLRQYLYCCTSKASKMHTCQLDEHAVLEVNRRRQHTSAYVSIRQHTSAYVSIRQHTQCSRLSCVSAVRRPRRRQHMSAYVSICQHMSAYVRIRQPPDQTSTYVSIRQHTSAYVSIPGSSTCVLED
jgi:hypothetical protein